MIYSIHICAFQSQHYVGQKYVITKFKNWILVKFISFLLQNLQSFTVVSARQGFNGLCGKAFLYNIQK